MRLEMPRTWEYIHISSQGPRSGVVSRLVAETFRLQQFIVNNSLADMRRMGSRLVPANYLVRGDPPRSANVRLATSWYVDVTDARLNVFP